MEVDEPVGPMVPQSPQVLQSGREAEGCLPASSENQTFNGKPEEEKSAYPRGSAGNPTMTGDSCTRRSTTDNADNKTPPKYHRHRVSLLPSPWKEFRHQQVTWSTD